MNLVQHLSRLNLIQEPPRRRTVLACDGPISLEFPWVSIGMDELSRVYVFFHARAWVDLKDAKNILYLVGMGFHAYDTDGMICLEDQMDMLIGGRITPAEAFWMTGSEYNSAAFQEWYPGGKIKPEETHLVSVF